jgi:exonuclease III
VDFVGLQETMRVEFSDKELKQVEERYEFVWNWLPPEGHSGGILLGVKQEVVEVGAFDEGTFFISALLRHRKCSFKWEVLVVYGPAQHDRLELFLEELKQKCLRIDVPVVLGGDFNLIRGIGYKNNNNIDWRLIDLFNNFIADLQLMELKRFEGKYTWINKQANLVMMNLDKILISLEWSQQFPLCSSSSLIKVGSDHFPIILNSGEGGVVGGSQFHFEKQWC